MTLDKTIWTGSEELIQKIKVVNIHRIYSSITVIMLAAFFTNPIFAQIKKDTVISVYSAQNDTYNQMLDYSRPGKYHQLLADLVGTWTSKGKHFTWTDSVTSVVSLEFSATVVRKSFANGRYFISDVNSEGTLEMPIQDGKMMTVKYQGLEIEGYDNVKNKFIRTAIGNHLLSSFQAYEGTYDPKAKIIAFNAEFELIPGMKTKDQFLFIFIDNDHYKWEYYQEEKGKLRLGTEINFIRITEK